MNKKKNYETFNHEMSLAQLYELITQTNFHLHKTGLKINNRLFISLESIEAVKTHVKQIQQTFDFKKVEERYSSFKAKATYPNGDKIEGYYFYLHPSRVQRFIHIQEKPSQVKIVYHTRPIIIRKQQQKISKKEIEKNRVEINNYKYYFTNNIKEKASKLTHTSNKTEVLQKIKNFLLEEIVNIHRNTEFRTQRKNINNIITKEYLFLEGKEYWIQVEKIKEHKFRMISMY